MIKQYRVPITGRLLVRADDYGNPVGDDAHPVRIAKVLPPGNRVARMIEYDWDDHSCLIEVEAQPSYHRKAERVLGTSQSHLGAARRKALLSRAKELPFQDASV